MLPRRLQLAAQGGRHGTGHGVQILPQSVLIRHGKLCRVGGRRRTKIGHVVGNGHIRLVSHGGDHGNFRFINGMGDQFVVERPQILNGAAASANDQQIGELVTVGIPDGRGDFPRRFRALHPNGQEPHLCQRIPLSENAEHIMHRRAGGTGDDSDGAGAFGQRLFAGGVK